MTAVLAGLADDTTAARLPLLDRPLASYKMLLTCTLLLLGLGLVMVFSASALRSYRTDQPLSIFAFGFKQALFIGLGLPLMYVASRTPVRVFKALAYPALLGTVALLVLVLIPGIGDKVNGARSWIPIAAGFNVQPAELAKLALILWSADLLARKQRLLGEYRHLLVPLVPAALVVLGLVMLQPDLGTAIVLSAIVVSMLWVIGTPLRVFAGLVGGALALGVVLATSSSHGMDRLTSFRDPFADAEGIGFQAVQGFYALSSGGWFGVGLGASREKWSGGLPEAHTDYVFAIIGEELGLLGTLTVLGLFCVLLASGVRIAQRSDDTFVRLACFAVTAWLGCQAILNMGAVVGLLPITGLPLPLVSYGGSAMLVTLAAIGMLLSFARQEPGAEQVLRARPALRDRLPAGVLRQRTGSRAGISRGGAVRRGAAPAPRAGTGRAGRAPGRR